MIRIYPVIPNTAPRQSRRDAWKPRPCVLQYRGYRDELTIKGLKIPEGFHHAIFILPMPASWSARKRAEHEGMPHRQKPDRDNLEKALLDSAFGEDAHVWNGATTKLWGQRGVVLISDAWLDIRPPMDLSHVYRACDEWRVNEPEHGPCTLWPIASARPVMPPSRDIREWQS